MVCGVCPNLHRNNIPSQYYLWPYKLKQLGVVAATLEQFALRTLTPACLVHLSSQVKVQELVHNVWLLPGNCTLCAQGMLSPLRSQNTEEQIGNHALLTY